MKKSCIDGTEMRYILNWIFAGGRIGQPFEVDNTFLEWLREQFDEESVWRIIRKTYEFDRRTYDSAEKYLKLKETSEYAKEETA